MGHAGLGVTIFGIACITAWQTEDIRVLRLGESFEKGGYVLRLDAIERTEGPNYVGETAHLAVLRDREEIGALTPEKRFYPVQRMGTTEAAIDRTLRRDLYVTLGDAQEGGGYAIRTYVKPFANWIWIGAMIMAAGGVASLTDRRFRVGAPARRRAPARAAVPAE
jgi:cytochrome c-type biogenesis protein CcmF